MNQNKRSIIPQQIINMQSLRQIKQTIRNITSAQHFNTNCFLQCIQTREMLYINFLLLFCWIVAHKSPHKNNEPYNASVKFIYEKLKHKT